MTSGIYQHKKGYKLSEEHKRKISETNKKNPTCYWLGKKRPLHSLESKIKMSEAHKGEKHYNWQGGITTYERKLYLNMRRRIMKIGNGGEHTQGDWETLKAQYNWTCPCCHKSEPEIKLTVDHIISLLKGGSDNIENIQPLCRSCNSKKHTKIIKYE